MSDKLDIYIDGAAKGNPGPAGIGAIICQGNSVIKNISQFIGEASNNVAEYTALIYGLQAALILKAREVRINTDSELMAKQLNCEYKVKNQTLRPLFAQVQHLLSGFKNFEIRYIPRKENKGADKLATSAIKREQVKVVAPT